MTPFQKSQEGSLNESYRGSQDSKVGKTMHLTQNLCPHFPPSPSKTV